MQFGLVVCLCLCRESMLVLGTKATDAVLILCFIPLTRGGPGASLVSGLHVSALETTSTVLYGDKLAKGHAREDGRLTHSGSGCPIIGYAGRDCEICMRWPNIYGA